MVKPTQPIEFYDLAPAPGMCVPLGVSANSIRLVFASQAEREQINAGSRADICGMSANGCSDILRVSTN